MSRNDAQRKKGHPRVPSLVRPTKDFLKVLGKKRPPYLKDVPLVFMGEIANMPEHGVFVGMKTGKVYSGYHIFNFEEVPDSET
jgi:hypothetical protein